MRKRKPGSPLARWILLLVAFVMLLLSAAMALPGLWLAALGGSFYYLIAGAGGIWACFTILRGRYVAGVGWFALVTLGTILWALWEIDRKAWMHAWGFDLAGRVGLHIAVLLIMLVPLSFIRERRGGRSDHGMAALILGIPLVLIGIGMGLTVFLRGLEDAPQQVAEVPVPPSAELPQRDTAGIGRSGLKRGPEEWVAFGGDNLGQRFSQATYITPENVSRLEQLWEFRTRDEAPSDRVYYAFQNLSLIHI